MSKNDTSIRRRSIENQIFKNLLLVASIPVILAAVLFYVNFAQNTTEKYKRTLHENLTRCVQLINAELDMFVQKSNSVVQNKYLMKSLQNDYKEDIEKMMVFFDNLDILIAQPFGSGNKGYFAIYPFSGDLYEGSYIERFDRIKDNAVVKEVVAGKRTDIHWVQDIYEKKYANNTRYIQFYRNIIDFKTPVGLLEGNIPYAKIEYLMTTTGIPQKGLIFATNQQGNILYYENRSFENIEDPAKMDMDKFLKLSQQVSNGHIITVAIPMSLIHKENLSVFLIMLAVLTIIIVAMVLVFRYSVHRTTRRFADFMKSIGNNDMLLLNDELIEISGEDEVAVIQRRFKALISRINELHTEIRRTQQQKSTFRMELLQSRINPHLLYNSLSVIKWNAQWNKDEKTIELIDCMTKYYRMALNKGKNVIRMSDELEMIRQYVRINEYSYTSTYFLDIDCEEQILTAYTIKHLLQPIVENSILHGLNGMETGGKISIYGWRDKDLIYICVSDNGRGMEPEKIAQILSMKYSTNYGGYGIKNLIKRIDMYYGEDCGLSIDSELGRGTQITVKIRALEEKELEESLENT